MSLYSSKVFFSVVDIVERDVEVGAGFGFLNKDNFFMQLGCETFGNRSDSKETNIRTLAGNKIKLSVSSTVISMVVPCEVASVGSEQACFLPGRTWKGLVEKRVLNRLKKLSK